MADILYVFVSDARVGTLTKHGDTFVFEYEGGAQFDISVMLPRAMGRIEGPQCRRYFANLLPEGRWLISISQRLKVDPNDAFTLLESLGTDCAGAIAIHKDPDWTRGKGKYEPVDITEL